MENQPAYKDMSKAQKREYHRLHAERWRIAHGYVKISAEDRQTRKEESRRRASENLSNIYHNNPQLRRDCKIRIACWRYGITEQQVEDLNARKVCDWCGGSFEIGLLDDKPKKRSSSNPTIDHDHVTGNIRGVVCSKCNFKIGAMEAALNSGEVEKAQSYMAQHIISSTKHPNKKWTKFGGGKVNQSQA